MKPARLLFVAITLSVVAALLPAPPAGASFNNAGSVFNGTLTFSMTPQLTVALGGTGAPCSLTTAPTLDLKLTTSGGGWTTEVLAFTTPQKLSFTYAGATYFMDLAKNSTGPSDIAGTIGSAPTYLWTQALRTVGRIYGETSPGSCTPDTTVLCTFHTYFPTLGGSVQSPGGITGEDINVSSVLAAGGFATAFSSICVAPFSTINNKTATISNMQAIYP